jgi:hypothetical protein
MARTRLLVVKFCKCRRRCKAPNYCRCKAYQWSGHEGEHSLAAVSERKRELVASLCASSSQLRRHGCAKIRWCKAVGPTAGRPEKGLSQKKTKRSDFLARDVHCPCGGVPTSWPLSTLYVLSLAPNAACWRSARRPIGQTRSRSGSIERIVDYLNRGRCGLAHGKRPDQGKVCQQSPCSAFPCPGSKFDKICIVAWRLARGPSYWPGRAVHGQYPPKLAQYRMMLA